jgi:hypothetical protein
MRRANRATPVDLTGDGIVHHHHILIWHAGEPSMVRVLPRENGDV